MAKTLPGCFYHYFKAKMHFFYLEFIKKLETHGVGKLSGGGLSEYSTEARRIF